MDEIAAAIWKPGGQRPYIFGAEARPTCTNCRNTSVWGQFCQYRGSGPVCPDSVRQELLAAWVERGYELPLTLTPCDFWRHIKGRTLYMMGDSMMLDFFKAMKCFMFEFWPTLDNAPLTTNKTLVELLTTSTVEPRCARLVHNTSICYVRTDEGQDFHGKALPALLENNMFSQGDTLIVNFGLHHGTSTYQTVLKGFAAFYKQNVGRLPRLFWQQTLAQHFDSPNGEFNGGKPPFKCHAIRGFKKLQARPSCSLGGEGAMELEPGYSDKYGLQQGLWRNKAADAVMRASGIPIIGSFNESVPMWKAHRDNGQGYECTHPCHPAASQASRGRCVGELLAVLLRLAGGWVGTC
ncbi:hypothetical protein ABPG77_010523 [Micractinium sp. CCAP 211/92]